MKTVKFVVGFVIGAVGGWRLTSSLLENHRTHESPAIPADDGGQEEASQEPANVVPLWAERGEGSQEDVDGYKAARSRVDRRLRELEERRGREAA